MRVSQAHRKMDVTRERISRILQLREILLSFQTGFNLVNAAVVCAILEITKDQGHDKRCESGFTHLIKNHARFPENRILPDIQLSVLHFRRICHLELTSRSMKLEWAESRSET